MNIIIGASGGDHAEEQASVSKTKVAVEVRYIV
jgi:hypothetical protein